MAQTNSSPSMRRVEDWKSRLIDLTRRNNLLYFHTTKRGNLPVNKPDVETIFKELVIKKKRLQYWLPPEEETTDAAKNKENQAKAAAPEEPKKPLPNQLVSENFKRADLERILKNLQRRSLLDYRERGVRILYAAFGRLNWIDSETKETVHSPLVLVPLELTRETIRKPFEISVPPVEEEAIANPALQVKLKVDFKIDLPVAPEDWEDVSLADYFSAVSQAVKQMGWTVESTVDLGLFSFHKLVIYKDLESNADLVTQHPIIRAIVGIKDEKLVLDQLPEEKDVDKIELPEKTYQVLDADSSQRVSIEYALRGQSFVMQGPPGTGKSQTIANIIAESIAHGKSVLFVSDKMAALEVVYKRLSEVGLAHFCLELHSSKANKQEVVAELKRSLDEHLVPRKLPSAHEFETMKSYRDSLNGYVTALHEKRPYMQKSAYEILSLIASFERVPYVAVGLTGLSTLTPQKISELENLTSQLSKVWQVVEEPDFPWVGYRASIYNLEVRSELLTALEAIDQTVEDLQLEGANFSGQLGLSPPANLERTKWLISLGKLLYESPKPEAQWLTNKEIDKLITEAKSYNETCQWIKTTKASLLERYNPTIFNLAFDRSDELKQGLTNLGRLFPNVDMQEAEFLAKQEKLLAYVKATGLSAKKWQENARALAEIFGLPTENLNLQNAKLLSKMALFCFTEDKPEVQWFDPVYFQQVQNVVAKARDAYQQHNLMRERLTKSYTSGIYDLELDELITRYNGTYQSFTRMFSSTFGHDQKAIAKVSIDGRVPKNVLSDLIDARKVKALHAEIDSQAENIKSLLGRFYQGYDTDFLRVERAIHCVNELKQASWATPLPENLQKLVTSTSSPSPMIKHLGSELEDSIGKWEQQTKEVAELIPERFPYSDMPLTQTTLQQVEEWTADVEKQLAPLCMITKETLSTSKTKPPKNYKQLLEDLTNAEEVRRKEAAITGEKFQLQIKYGARFNELETNWIDIISVLEWSKRVQTAFGDVAVPETYALLAAAGPSKAPSDSKLARYYENTLQSIAGFEARFESELKFQNQKLRNLDLPVIYERIKALRDRVDELQVWIDFKDLRNRFSLRGLGGFFGRLVEQKTPKAQLIDVFRRGTYQEWINNLYNEDPRLGRFRRENHEQLITDFKKLDKDLIHLTSSMVIEAANSRKPQDILIQANDSEASILMKEAAKKRRLMPIRTLMQKIPNLLVKLKPCLLMSPISVSQFLSPEAARFDLVLFDEASQIVPEDAIGSIYRGKTLVVAGDNKQLPPTSFFQKSLIDDIDWDQISDADFEVFDSILDECLGIGLPVKTLRWHYRSKHEDLIAFSNHQFYDDTLITFPAAKAKHDSLGVKMVYVPDGLYDRGGRRDNQREAEKVADLVFDHFTNYPKKTLGVVTFSIAQMEAIEEAIDRRLKEQPDFDQFFKEDRLEGFFVKNLENVQGDERDVIFFSVGYGYDPNGQMAMNFGPLNKPGGERRLNVAVTRAREKVIIVTSIKAADIDSEAKAQGVQTLRFYLDYADKGPELFRTPQQKSGAYESALDEDVASEIQKLGYEVVPQVGYSGFKIDIGVIDPVNPGCYLMGVECDGATYKSSCSARDRDRLREQVLKGLGWSIHRIWSPSWVARRDSEVKRLKEALEQAQKLQLDKEILKPAVTPKEDGLEAEVRKVQFAGIEKIGAPYKIYPLKAMFNPYIKVQTDKATHTSKQKNEFHYPANREIQTRLLGELIDKEGPIHFDYAVERLSDAWGIKRITPKINHAVQEALNTLLRDQKVVIKGSFLWPPMLKDVQIRVPVEGIPETKRKLEHIAPEEVEAAMKLIAQYALGISDESLVAETAKVFGLNHSTDKSKEYFNEILKRLIRERKLAIKDNVVTLA